MSGRLFAFRVAKPAETIAVEVAGEAYDPETQTSIWQGDTEALARHTGRFCLHRVRGRRFCENPYGPDGCQTFGEYGVGGRRYVCQAF